MKEGLLHATRQVAEDRAQQKKDDIILCAHIRTALSTESGKVLKEWLKGLCYSDRPRRLDEIESAEMSKVISALRDLFIELETRELRGAYVTDSK